MSARQASASRPTREWPIVGPAWAILRPPPRMSLSEWADQHYVLSAESAAAPGRWRTLPYQRGIMDALTDPKIERVSLMKSARIGYTKMIDALIGFHMHHDPCPIMVVQPTVEDAKGYSKDEIAPMLRDCPALSGVVSGSAHVKNDAEVSSSTILDKKFRGGSLSMVGANSGRGFRRVSRRIVIFDEVDGYPPSAGSEGDQIKLGEKRSEYYWNRKIVLGSTPLVAGTSRIEQMFEAGDRRRYHVPCPQCWHMDFLSFRERPDGRGHWMSWPEDEPEQAHFVCRANGCVIEEAAKLSMLESGHWIGEEECTGHASFQIWAAYSMSPNASWSAIAKEFLDAVKRGHEALKTFVNTVLGETWQERGEAPDWDRLYARREQYAIGSLPSSEIVLVTAGVDVQSDRFVYEVVGWAADKRSWSIEAGELYGSPSHASSWAQLDELLSRTYVAADGTQLSIGRLAIDSGYATQEVYGWARRHSMSRVIAIKGVTRARAFVGLPTAVDVTTRGKRVQGSYRVWPVASDIGKREFYGWLRLPVPTDDEQEPPGWCHFPAYDAEYFRQITSEQLVTIRKKSGVRVLEWHVIPGRQNHWLDARIYARAAATASGLDRGRVRQLAAPVTPTTKPQAQPPSDPDRCAPAKESPRKRPRRQRGGWMSRRRDRI